MRFIANISKKSWKAKYRLDIAAQSETKNFFEQLSIHAATKKWLSIWLMYIADKPIAYEYQLNYLDSVYALRSDFDESYKMINPGSVLNAHIIQYIFSQNMREYDMGGNNNSYKLNWTSLIRNHREFIIYNNH